MHVREDSERVEKIADTPLSNNAYFHFLPFCFTKVYGGPLSGQRATAVLFNRSPVDANISVDFAVCTRWHVLALAL